MQGDQMRKSRLGGAILVAALALQAAPAMAQSGGWTVGVHGGATLPMGDAGDAFKTGFGGGVNIMMRPAGGGIGYGIEAQVHRLSLQDGADGNLTGFAGFGRLEFPVASQLYVIGGAGIFRSESTIEGPLVELESTSSDFAIQGGLGINLGRTLFAEAKLINVFGDESSQFLPITIGIRF
jgi:hypothetical protein